MTRWLQVSVGVALVATGLPRVAATQAVAQPAALVGPAPSTVAGATRLGTADPVLPASWLAPLASLAVPGAGQSMLRQPRSVAYVAAEAFLVIQYLAAQRDGNRGRDAYRQLAAEVARKRYGGTRLGPWDYYESMEKFLESGAYDMVPGGAVDPEMDITTFNGARWLLARQTFWANPNVAPATTSAEYQRALAFYLASAVGDDFRWSWRDQQLQQDIYRQSIRTANRSYQRATNLVGIVAVNHLASLIDAYITVRLRRYGTGKVAGRSLDGVTTAYGPGVFGQGELHVGVRIK